MDRNNLPMIELQRLLSRVSEHGNQHLQAAEADLEQTSFLLEQAIKTLSGGFMQINQLVSQQQQLLGDALQTHDIEATQRFGVLALREKIHLEINTVVTGLQFQDLTNQLIMRTVKRISGLRDLLTVLANHRMDTHTSQNESIEELLEKIHDSLSLKSGALKDGLSQEVKQKHMVSGEIELF